MKTIDDVLNEFPEWPTWGDAYNEPDAIALCVRVPLDMNCALGALHPVCTCGFKEECFKVICTREEYEQTKAERGVKSCRKANVRAKCFSQDVAPEVGERIEYRAMDTNEWFEGVYVARHTCSDGIEINVIECNEQDPHSAAFDGLPDVCIRPIKTKREKFIEEAKLAVALSGDIFGAMYDSGKFKLVGDE